MSKGSKLKEIGRKILKRGYNLLEGSGIGKIPGVTRIFLYISSLFFEEIIEVDGQKFRPSVAEGFGDTLEYITHGGIEPHVSSLFCSMLEKGMTVVDIGANIGYYTLLAAKRIGVRGQVISFEPDPFNYKRLVENVQMNGWNNVKAFQLAVSDFNGEKKLNIPKLGRSGSTFVIRSNIANSITVNTISLDSFLRDSPDLIKIDVEGAELEVLRGMRNILAIGKVKLICEIHPALLSSLGYSTKEIEDLLKHYEYNIYLVKDDGSLLLMDKLLNRSAHYLFTKERIK